jgi:O-antigen/teichoic acid export membrane protein
MPNQPSNTVGEKRSQPALKIRLAGVYKQLVSGTTARNGLMSVIGQGALSVASLVTATYIGRVGGKEQLGLYALALTIVYTMRAVQGELVVAPYTIYWHRKKDSELATYRGSAVLHQLFLCGVTSLGLAVFLLSLSLGFGPAKLMPTIAVLIIASPFILSRCFARHVMFAHMHFGTALAIDLITAGTQIAALLIVGYLGALTAPVAFGILGVVCGAATLAWYLTTPHAIEYRTDKATTDWKENWQFARWALASNLVGCTTPYVMPWLLHAAHSTSETGYYAAGTTLIGLTHIYVIGIANYLTPRATQVYVNQGTAQLRSLLIKTCPVIVLPIIAFAILLFVTGDFFPTLCFGAEYTDLGVICTILAAAAAINAIGIAAGNGFWAIDRPKDNLWADGTVLITTVIAALLLAIPYGPIGASVATLIGVTCGTIVRGTTLHFKLRSISILEAAKSVRSAS